MGDFLFSFTGRKKVLSYWLSIILAVLAAAGVAQIPKLLGDWPYSSIIVMTLAVLPIIIYLSATVRRFKDRGRHPIVGFLAYFAIPAIICWAAGELLGHPEIFLKVLDQEIQKMLQADYWTQQLAMQWGAIAFAFAIFLIGQICLFLLPGTKGENVFDEAVEAKLDFE